MADVSFTFTGDSSSLQHALADIRAEVAETKQAVGSVASQLTATFAAVAGAIAAVRGAIAGMAGISNAAAEMEQTGLALRVMLKDANKAAQYMDALRKYAAETPFEFGDISEASKVLLSMGTAADKSIEVIKKLGDVASVSGKPLKELAYIYAKAQNSGLTNEVAEQFELQGVPIRKLLAELKGISFQDVFKGISQRQFGLEDVDAVLEKITGPGGLLENMTKLQSQTFSGVLSTLTDNIANLGVELGTPINAAILPVLNDIIAAVDSMAPAVQSLGKVIGAAFANAAAIVSPMASTLSGVAGSLGGVKTAVAAAAAALLIYTGRTQQAAAATEEIHLRLLTLRGVFSQFNITSVASAFRSSLASMQTSTAAAFASIRTAMTLDGLRSAWTATFASLSVRVKSTLATVNAGINATLSGIRAATVATLAGMRVAWSATWAGIVAVTRTSCLAIKGALVSTGLGVLFVIAGEGLAALYSWFANIGEAAKQAADSMRAFRDVQRALNDEAKNATTEEGKQGFQRNVESHIERITEERRAAREDGNEELEQALTRQLQTLREIRREGERRIDANIEAAKQAERENAVIRQRGEEIDKLQRKLEQARERMGNMVAQQAEREREHELAQFSRPRQIELRLSDVGHTSLASLKAAMDAMEQRVIYAPADADEYARLVETYNAILKLQQQIALEDEKSAKEAAKKREEAEAATRKYEDQLAILQAEIAGDQKRMQYLKDEQRVAELVAEYRRQGLADAEAAARRMVAAEIEAAAVRDKAGKKEEARATRMASSWIQSSQASVGGGGRSYLVGGEAILAESRKQTTGIIQCRDRIDRLRSTPIKVEVTSVVGE